MSVSDQITRISTNVSDTLSAIESKGVTVPVGSTSDNMAALVSQIPVITQEELQAQLANYYLKSETYSQEEINSKISAIPKFSIEVVSSLPTSNISSTTIYLVTSGEETPNLYTEYIYTEYGWEKLGTQTVDLSGYATESWVNNQGFLKTVNLSTNVTGGLPVANGGTGVVSGLEDFALGNLAAVTMEDSYMYANTKVLLYSPSYPSKGYVMPIEDFKTALGVSGGSEPYIKTVNSAEWIETASSSDTTIAAMTDFGKYCYKIAATTHNKGVNPIVQMRYVRPFNTVGHFVNISSNSIVDGDGNVYIFSNNVLYNNNYMYSVIIR